MSEYHPEWEMNYVPPTFKWKPDMFSEGIKEGLKIALDAVKQEAIKSPESKKIKRIIKQLNQAVQDYTSLNGKDQFTKLTNGDPSKFISGSIGDECIFGNINKDSFNKPMSVSCPCKKCSPYCYTSIV